MSGSGLTARATRQAARAKELEQKKQLLLEYKTKTKNQQQTSHDAKKILELKKSENLDDFLRNLNSLVPTSQKSILSESNSTKPTIPEPSKQLSSETPKSPQTNTQQSNGVSNPPSQEVSPQVELTHM